MREDLIQKIKKAGLTGRGGACYPTWQKWQAVHDAVGAKKYVVCNASEGEPEVRKDGYILEHHPERVIDGMKIAIYFLKADMGFIYLNPAYYEKFKPALKKLIGTAPIEIFNKPHSAGYIGGEETSAINTLEGRRTEPRLRPPFPVTRGFKGCPTLVNNVETLYNVSLVRAGQYKGERFYTLSGDLLWSGVYLLPEELTIAEVLEKTKNYPKFPFFVQVGGGASGSVLNEDQAGQKAGGAGSITVYSYKKHEPLDIMRKWINFFERESCGQCTPCREGTFRIREILYSKDPDWTTMAELLLNLKETAFCGLGCAVPIPFSGFIKNVLPRYNQTAIKLPEIGLSMICECMK
jgi:NADH:ubiquinone oxidoreductase subunit F (NADH-binding)